VSIALNLLVRVLSSLSRDVLEVWSVLFLQMHAKNCGLRSVLREWTYLFDPDKHSDPDKFCQRHVQSVFSGAVGFLICRRVVGAAVVMFCVLRMCLLYTSP
jgi:hypothetical protein